MKPHDPSHRRRGASHPAPADPQTPPQVSHGSNAASPEVSLAHHSQAGNEGSDSFAGAIKAAVSRASVPSKRTEDHWGVIPGLSEVTRQAASIAEPGTSRVDGFGTHASSVESAIGVGLLREIVAKGLAHQIDAGSAVKIATEAEGGHGSTGGGTSVSTSRADALSGPTSRIPGLVGVVSTGIEPRTLSRVMQSQISDTASTQVASSSIPNVFDASRSARTDLKGAQGEPDASIGGIDPSVTGLIFPGQSGFERETGRKFMGDQAFSSSADRLSGHFGSVTNPDLPGNSLDLARTNDLINQLLDEIRKGDRPFLPVNDRNANY